MSELKSIPEEFTTASSSDVYEEIFLEDDDLNHLVDVIKQELGDDVGQASAENVNAPGEERAAAGEDNGQGLVNQKEKENGSLPHEGSQNAHTDSGVVADQSATRTSKGEEQQDASSRDTLLNKNDGINDGINDGNNNPETKEVPHLERAGVNLDNFEKRSSERVAMNGNGNYDNYLIEKLLHSEADPSEEHLEDGFEKPPVADQNDVTEEETEMEREFRRSPESGVQIAAKEAEQGPDVQLIPVGDTSVTGTKAGGMGDTEHLPSDREGDFHSPGVSGEMAQVTGSGAGDGTMDGEKQDGENLSVNSGEVATKNDDDVKTPRQTEEAAVLDQKTEGQPAILDDALKQLEDEEDDDDFVKPPVVKEVEIVIPESSDDDDDYDEELELGLEEMTFKQKKAVVKAARKGNIDLLEDLLDKRHADMNMLWYNENLVMIAIKARQQEMAEFLIDNDWDYNFSSSIVDASDRYKGPLKFYQVSCRQMAYDLDMLDIVELIDLKNGNLFRNITPRQREIRIRRPRPPTPPTPVEDDGDADDEISYTEDGEMCKIRRSKRHKSDNTEITDDDGLDVCKVELNLDDDDGGHIRKKERDADSGLQSFRTTEIDDHADKTINDSDQSDNDDDGSSNTNSSHVFGMDEGYETMSPFSPYMMGRTEPAFPSPREHKIRIRGTKASSSVYMHNLKTREQIAQTQDMQPFPIHFKPVETTGSYARESKLWHRDTNRALRGSVGSVASIPERVTTGRPWVHGASGNKQSKPNNRKHTGGSSTSKATRGGLSPYAQVARLLSESRLLNPSRTSKFPVISNERVYRQPSYEMRTDTNYTYAKRREQPRSDLKTFSFTPGAAGSKTDLLPRRKLKTS